MFAKRTQKVLSKTDEQDTQVQDNSLQLLGSSVQQNTQLKRKGIFVKTPKTSQSKLPLLNQQMTGVKTSSAIQKHIKEYKSKALNIQQLLIFLWGLCSWLFIVTISIIIQVLSPLCHFNFYVLVLIVGSTILITTVVISKIAKRKWFKITMLTVSYVISIPVLFLTMIIIQMYVAKTNIGPIITPNDISGFKISWWTAYGTTTVATRAGSQICGSSSPSGEASCTKRSNFHTLVVPSAGEVTLLGKAYVLEKVAPKTFTVTAGIYQNFIAQKNLQSTFTLYLGGLSARGSSDEMYFSLLSADGYGLVALSEADISGDVSDFQSRSSYSYDSGTNLFVVLQPLTQSGPEITQILAQFAPIIKQSKAANVFIALHNAVYQSSTKSYVQTEYAEAFHIFVTNLNEPRLRAVFTGENAQFTAYKRDGVYFFGCGSGGDYAQRPQWWPSQVLHGAVEGLTFSEYHQDSIAGALVLDVAVGESGVSYKVRDLGSGAVVAEYK